MSESKDKKIKDQLTYAYIRKVKKWMDCPNCMEGKLLINKESTIWHCDECGYELSVKEFEDDYVFWFCDGCGAYLNSQDGFDKGASTHICQNCGFENDITEANIKGECKDCGKLLDDPDAVLCKDCRQKRIRNGLIAAGVIAGAAVATAAVIRATSNAENNSIPVPDADKDTIKGSIQGQEISSNISDANLPETIVSGPSPDNIIYVTNEWNGYGKQNYYRNIYTLEENQVIKYKRHTFKFFNGKENEWLEEDKRVGSWEVNDPEMPEWIRRYI